MSPDLKQFILDRALGKPTIGLDPICEELFQMYMSDSNSSTLRETITVLVAGYDPVAGKHGRDAIDPVTGKAKEVKPKSYTGTPTNGSGCFNDYTRDRFEKDMKDGLDILHSLFVGDRLAYVVEFSIMAVQEKLDKHIRVNCEEKQQKYVRTAAWGYSDWIQHPTTKTHYIDWQLIDSNPRCINGNMYKALRAKEASLMEFLV
jgi:desulfoferrodoxin (superoxide reductase-like protein)